MKMSTRSLRRTAITARARQNDHSPQTEVLEHRIVLSTFTVTTLADSGPGSLREAVTSANAAAGADIVQFAHGLSGTINLASQLDVTDDLTINGTGPDPDPDPKPGPPG